MEWVLWKFENNNVYFEKILIDVNVRNGIASFSKRTSFFKNQWDKFKKEIEESNSVWETIDNKWNGQTQANDEREFTTEIEYQILISSSAAGVYRVPIFYKRNKKIHILISTPKFLKKWLNDEFIDTSFAKQNEWFISKKIHPKIFIRKHLELLEIPAIDNDISLIKGSYDELLNKDLKSLTIAELKNILKKYSMPSSGNKEELIKRISLFKIESDV